MKRVIDQEIARLPRDLQAAVVLCGLEGLTHKQAGVRLGIASSTVSDRVAKGRNRLHRQLLRRGATISGGLLAGLAVATSESAAALTAASIAELTTNATLVTAGHPISSASAVTAIQIANRVTTAMKTTKVISLAVVALLLVATVGSLPGVFLTANQLFAGPLFTEDFEGSFDGSWEVVHGRAIIETRDGKLVVRPTGEINEVILVRPSDANGNPILFGNVSIRASTEGAVAQMGVFTRMDFHSSSWLPEGRGSILNGLPPAYYGTKDHGNGAAIFDASNRMIGSIGGRSVDFPILLTPAQFLYCFQAYAG